MGFGGISIWQLLIVLAIVLLVFGTKRLRGVGGDVGSAIKGFKDSMKDGEAQGDDDAKQAAESVAHHQDEPAAAQMGTDAEAGAQPDKHTK